MIKDALERQYSVFTASKYSEAVNLLKKHIDLAIIDYNLPDCNGLELLTTIRNARPLLPAIIMTAYSSETLVIDALRAGATDYIKKPLGLKYLIRKVSNILGDSKAGYNMEQILSEGVANKDEFIMDGIAIYIEEKYMEALPLEKVAEIAHMNKNKFCSAFKNRFGHTLKSYLNHIRAQKAAGLLLNHDLSITEIAYFVGYGSIVHFERVFKKEYGESPREYRKRLKQEQ